NYSPGGFDNVLSVSALADFDGIPGALGSPTCFSDQDDTLAYFSNWGPEVDIAAPGSCILSTYPLEKGEYGTISGTSMASPHVAGALALLASRNNPANAADVYALYNTIKNNGNYDWTDDSGDGIKEPLLDVSSSLFNPVLVPGSGGVPTNNPPTANFTFNTSGLTANFSDTSSDSDGMIASWSWNFDDGATSTAQNPSHTYTAAGTYNVSLTVTDDDGATASTSKPVTVSAPPTGETVTVTSLTGSSSTVNKNFWKATVVVKIDHAMSGAVVSGKWISGTSTTCTTDTSGECTVTLNVRTKTTFIEFTVNAVTLAGYTYVPGVTSVTVNKP
ncbi:MAG: S8 family serine peptidase, partial [Anaerolineaceae bacterium]|nr:S8 family serine peptidase [Anaerolineaceae bacterium]